MENQDIEYKAVWRDEYLQWLCGFANARGGTIYVGIADDGEVVGVKNADRLLEDIPNKAIAALGIIPYVQLHRENGREFLEISIEPQDFPINCKGRYYLRSGATNQLLRGVGLDTFLLRRRGRTWDSVPVPNVRVQDLSRKAMDSFLGEARGGGRMPDDVAGDDAESLLRSLHLLEGGRCTNAAVLLFHPDPMAVFSSCFVKVGYFDGSEILFQDEVGGPIIEQVDKMLDLLYAKYLRARIDYDGAHRVERFPFPRAAVREAVVNAVVHRNYASTSPIQIRVCDDCLQIGNACILPEGWTVDDLLGFHESEPHNPKIAHVFFLAGLIERWGRGVQRIFSACKIDGVESPLYRMVGNSLQIVFTAPADRVMRIGVQQSDPGDIATHVHADDRDGAVLARLGVTWRDLARLGATYPDFGHRLMEAWDALSARDRSILGQLATDGPTRTADLSDSLGVSLRTVQRTMKKLAVIGLVSLQGKANESRYYLNVDSGKGE